ncbi:type III pantothenate kinase [Thalassotalea piscium]
MLILIDIGNTRSKYVIVENNQRSAIAYCDNELLNDNWLAQHFAQAAEIILANVNNDKFTKLIRQWAENKGIQFQLLATSPQAFGVTCAYDEPNKLGVDRWLGILAANLLYPNKACVVVDAGTATTIDAISPEGQHLGGWIFPGIDMLYRSLVDNTQKIIADKCYQPSIALGKNTSECVNNGSWAITLGAIELQLNHMKKSYENFEIIITGGNSHEISSQLSAINHVIDDLIFIGMQRFKQ